MKKHISFDVWNTLIKANPKHKAWRNDLLLDIVFPENNYSNYSYDILKQVKHYTDFSNEVTGYCMNWKQALLMYGFESYMMHNGEKILGIDKDIMRKRLSKFESIYFANFLDYCPLIYSDTTYDVLKILQDKGIGLSISCNTGTIPGNLVYKALDHLKIADLFNFHIYSDEIGLSKPNPAFFFEVMSRSDFREKDILHVGDNSYTDGGSVNFGIDSLIINDGKSTIETVLEYV